MNTDKLIPNDLLADEIQTTMAIVGATDTARALGVHHRTLAAYVKRRSFPQEIIARAEEIGLVKPPVEAV